VRILRNSVAVGPTGAGAITGAWRVAVRLTKTDRDLDGFGAMNVCVVPKIQHEARAQCGPLEDL